jgi:FKBP-type peptidyl-prolyl cis-trans isomerase (trigger factor)
MSQNFTHTTAKTDDGTININFSFPYEVIKLKREHVIAEEAKELTLPGFRKGMAPPEKVANSIDKETLIQKTLSHLLPDALSEVIKTENLVLALYPKFELISANENEIWQVRAISCELPSLDLGEYKKAIEEEVKNIKSENGKDNNDQKETVVLQQIIKTSTYKIPKLLIEEDVNQRLANLLDRVERLGLNLEGYLASVGKTPEVLRKEYEIQSEESLVLEIALNKIADQDKIEVTEAQVEEAIKVSSTDPKLAEELKKPEKRKLLASILRRQETLKKLVSSIS